MQVQSGVAEKWEKVQTGTANGNVPAAEYADAAMAIISVSPICRASRLRRGHSPKSTPLFARPSGAACVPSSCHSPTRVCARRDPALRPRALTVHSGVRLNQRHGHRQERHERQRQSHRQVRRAQPGQKPAGAPSAPRSAVRESESLAVAWQGKSQRTVAPCLWRDWCIWLCAMARVAHCATHEADCARVRHGWQALCDAELATGDVKKLIKGGTACCALLWLQRALIFIKVRPWGMRAPPPSDIWG